MSTLRELSIDLASTELEETLADKPLPKKGKVVAMSTMGGAESEQEIENESFELASWCRAVVGWERAQRRTPITREADSEDIWVT